MFDIYIKEMLLSSMGNLHATLAPIYSAEENVPGQFYGRTSCLVSKDGQMAYMQGVGVYDK